MRRRPVPIPRLSTLLVTSLAVVATAGCGNAADEERLQAERIARAERDAIQKTRLEEAAKDQRREQRRLRRELEKLKRERDRSGSAAPARTPAPASSASSGSACESGLSVGANTTCAFARAVRSAFEQSGGSSVVEAYSPVTNRSYTMSCSTSGVTTVCRGGNNASVFFR